GIAEIYIYSDSCLAPGQGTGTDQPSQQIAAFVSAWSRALPADLFAGGYGQCIDLLCNLCQHDVCFRTFLEISGAGGGVCSRAESGGMAVAAGLSEKPVSGFGRSGKCFS